MPEAHDDIMSQSSLRSAEEEDLEDLSLSEDLYGFEGGQKWNPEADLRPGEHILTIEVIPQPNQGFQHVVFFTDTNRDYRLKIHECKPGAKLRSIQADDGYELCNIEWKNGTVEAVQKPMGLDGMSHLKSYEDSAGFLETPRSGQHEEDLKLPDLPPGSPALSSQDTMIYTKNKHGKLGDVGTCSTFWEPGIVMSGWFEKRGGGKYSSDWRKRFAVLNPAREMLYYEDDRLQTAKGELHLPKGASIAPEGNLELQIVAKDRTWHFRYESSGVRDEWIDKMKGVLKSDDWGFCQARGLVQKKGKRFGGWTTRYVKLYDNKIMKYLNDEHSSILAGETALVGIQKVAYTSNDKDHEWEYGFAIHAENRIRSFRVRTQEERIMWVATLSKHISVH